MTFSSLLKFVGPIAILLGVMAPASAIDSAPVMTFAKHFFTEGLTIDGALLPIEVQIIIVGLRVLTVVTFGAFLALAFVHLARMFKK